MSKRRLGDLPISGIGPWATPPCLSEQVVLAYGATHLEGATDGVFVENRLDLEIDIQRAPQPRLRTGEAIPQALELFAGYAMLRHRLASLRRVSKVLQTQTTDQDSADGKGAR